MARGLTERPHGEASSGRAHPARSAAPSHAAPSHAAPSRAAPSRAAPSRAAPSRAAAVALGGLVALAAWQIVVAVGCGGTDVATVASGIDGSVSSCSQLPLNASCYADEDCAKSTHCTLVGLDSDMDPVTCCVAGGDPGKGDGGAPCTGPDDCASGVCAYTSNANYCSVPCKGPGDSAGCPSVLPLCVAIVVQTNPDAGAPDAAADAGTPDASPPDAGTHTDYFCGIP
jgi:hypothetical protein